MSALTGLRTPRRKICPPCAEKKGLDRANRDISGETARSEELAEIVPEPTLHDVLCHINSERLALRAGIAQVTARRAATRKQFQDNPKLLAQLLCGEPGERQIWRKEEHSLASQLQRGEELLEGLRVEACEVARAIAVASGTDSCEHVVFLDEPSPSTPSVSFGEIH
jgi:hypothetical protein